MLPYNTPLVTHLGVVDVPVGHFGANFLDNQATGQTGKRCIEFATNSPTFDLNLFCLTDTWVWVWVDGKPLEAAPHAIGNTWTGGSGYHQVTFTGGARWRTVRVYLSGAQFGGINLPIHNTTDLKPLYQVRSTPKPAFSFATLGDSYTDDTGCLPFNSFAWILAYMLGAECYELGIGGTGYVAPGSATPFGSSARIAPLATIKPTWLLFAGSINDGSYSASSVGTAAAAAFAAAKAATPSSIMLVDAVQRTGDSASSANTANDAAVLASASAAGITILTDPTNEPRVTGTGHAAVAAPTLLSATASTSGGSGSAGTYFWIVTDLTVSGETTRSNEVSATVAASGTATLRIATPNPGATSRRIYRGTSAGAENVKVYDGSVVSSWTDTMTSGTSATVPSANTTGNVVGDGTADRFVMADGIHPAPEGHLNEAHAIYNNMVANSAY